MRLKTRIFSAILALMTMLSTVCVCAAEKAELTADSIEIIFTDVTDTRTDVLEGEAKIMVSIKGVEGNASIVQTSLKFSGGLKYKSITFLKGENNPPECFLYTPNAALVNSKKTLMPSIISIDESIELSGTTDLFVLTFAGEPGDSVTVSTNDLDSTYCVIDGEDIYAEDSASESAEASDKAVRGKTASIQLTMDVVTDFAGPASSGYKSSGIEVRITSRDNDGYTIYTVLNNANISKGGHRVGSSDSSIPTFIIENTVLEDDKYDIEISGIGYVPVVLKKVDFDDPIEITNEDLIPGDVDGDGEVTEDDKELCNEVMAEKDYSEACDFNRDNKVDKYDLAVFDKVLGGGNDDEDDEEEEDKITVPSKVTTGIVATGGEKSVSLRWTAPDNGGAEITSYTVKYGKSKISLSNEVTVTETKAKIDELLDGTTYYFSIIATNEIGDSEASIIVNATTNPAKEEDDEEDEDDATVPGVVTEISSTAKSSSITLKWDAPESDGGSAITQYKIKYGTNKTKLSSSKTFKNVDEDLELKISSLSSGKTYYFQIAAVNAKGTGEYSEIYTASTTGGGGGDSGGGPSGGPTGGPSTPPPVSAPTYYAVTFDIGAGTIASGSAVINVEKNAKPGSVPTVTAPAGKEFAGWSRDNGASFIDPTNVIVTANITFTAIYKDKEAVVAPEVPAVTEVFTDLESHAWAKDSIYTLKNKGIINGTTATTFAPANNIKRGDFILILVRMLGITAETTENFDDVPADSYYANAIAIAKSMGIATGYENKFRPEDTITRQDLITLAYRAFLAKGFIAESADTASLEEFLDKGDISEYAVPAMSSMVGAGIIKGSEGKVNPKNNATRAEVAVMCARLLALMK